MGLAERSRERRKRMVGNIAHNHEEAAAWDREFWLGLTPEQRLEAVEDMKHEVEEIRRGRMHQHRGD